MFFAWAESGRSAGFAGYGHFAWTLQDGSPADIWAMAQSDDGYLWLATGFGLYRFDGVRFERFRPRSGGALPSTNITAITILPSGDTWIGYASDGYPPGKAYWMELDHAGALWVAGEHTILVRRPGQYRFQDTGIAVAPQAILAVSRQGEMWLSDARRGTRPIRHSPQGYHDAVEEFPELSAVQAARLLFLPDGSLWGTRRGRGLFRTALPGADSRMGGAVGRTSVQFFHKADGLTSDIAVPLFEDREGNLWVGTILGLNRFRYRNVVALPAALATPGGFDQVIHGDDGGVVVVSSTGTMLPINRDVMQRLLDGGALTDEVARSRPTTWWLGEGDGLWRVERGQVTRHAFPGEPDGVITDAMLVDARRRIWLAVRGRGVFVRDSADWNHRIEFSSPTPIVMATGPDERVWLGYKEGGIAVVDDGHIEAFAADATLAVGAITALHPRQQDAIIAGELGIAHFDGTRFRSFLEEPALFGVTGILEDSAGFLWLNGSRGLARVHSSELARAKGGDDAVLNPVLFDQIDGLPGVALQAKAVPSAASADGLLWFSTNGGVAMIDPERVRANERPPDVHVLSVSSASTVLDGATGGSLPPGAGTVRIAYTATSLSAPERVQFRYRFDGLDKDWNEVGGWSCLPAQRNDLRRYPR